MPLSNYVPTTPQDTIWDVVVIGTGAGGGPAGLTLAQSGRSVLFLERGKFSLPAEDGLGREEHTPGERTYSLDTGWWPHRIDSNEVTRTQPNIGCSTGGSTALFGMVLDRFRPIDFTPHRFASKSTPHSLPEVWPIEYTELEPYYRKAEALFRVRGTEDPLTPTGGPLLTPLPSSDAEIAIHETLSQHGLHSYKLHQACERIAGCDGSSCIGKLCSRACRNDTRRMCILPALEQHAAHILPECLAVKLNTKGCEVTSVECVWNDQPVTIRARVFVLALHALLTPCLLLRSASETFPDGLGNSSGMVGRNLMWHISDSFLVQFHRLRGKGIVDLNHGISFNDFYLRNGVKLGNIHGHTLTPGRLTRVAPSASDLTGTTIFHTILEDFPYAENRVAPIPGGDSGVRWEYTRSDELLLRNKMLNDAFADTLSSDCSVKLLEPSGQLNQSHTCGTCRFGDDPRRNVLDRNNRMHDLDNAYVVDGSFFPSSGGINPSLTILANSLRVGEVISHR